MKKIKEQKDIRFNSRKRGLILPTENKKEKTNETDKTKLDIEYNDEVGKFFQP